MLTNQVDLRVSQLFLELPREVVSAFGLRFYSDESEFYYIDRFVSESSQVQSPSSDNAFLHYFIIPLSSVWCQLFPILPNRKNADLLVNGSNFLMR